MNPVSQQIIQFFQNNQPRPITSKDIATAINAPFEDVVAALTEMLSQGYVYRGGSAGTNFYWYPTKYVMDIKKKKVTSKNWTPASAYTAHQTALKKLTPDNRDKNFEAIQAEMDQYYPYFTQNHPEYSKLFQWLDRNVAHKKELLKDAAALFLRMDVKHNAIAYPGEKKYKIPDYLITVENAMYESMTRFINNMPDKRKEVLSQDEYYDAYNKVSQLTANIQQKFIDEVVKVTPKGAVIPNDAIEKFIEKDIAKIVPDKKHADMFLGMVSGKLATEAVDPAVYKVFFVNTPPTKIADVLSESLLTGIKMINTFNKTCPDEKIAVNVYHEIFSDGDLSTLNLSGIQLTTPFVMEAMIFNGTNFDGSNWSNVKVQNCDFTNAKITRATFMPAVFTSNIVKNLDLLDSAVNKKIKWDDNPGTPLNLFIRDVDYDKDKLNEVNKSPNFRFASVPLKEEELDDAKVVAMSLKKFLEGKDVFGSSFLQLYKVAVLDKNTVTQLKNWLSDENPQVPDFMPAEQLKDWLIENSKNGELAKAGFEPKEVSILFKRSREVVSPQAQRISPEDQKKQDRDKKINQFLSQYQGQDSLPPEALLSLLTYREGNLYGWFSVLKKQLSYIDLQKIYYALVSSLKDYHVNPYVKPIRRYEAFPHSTHMNALKGRGGDFGWRDTHSKKLFAVALTADLTLMPPDIAKSTQHTVTYGGGHIQNALAYSRIAPLSYTLTSVKGKPATKYVWFIVEMQSDPFQHALKSQFDGYKELFGDQPPKRDEKDLQKEIAEKFDKSSEKNKYENNLSAYEAVTEFRSYFKHWPENLMNSIITLAGENNVDEIWMPKGADVQANVNSKTDWTYNYDRPAKVFGGKLKDVGVQVLLDPGFTDYTKKVSNVYVIEISKGDNLKLDWGVAVEDSAEEIAQDTMDSFNFNRYQMPYWIRLAQHILDGGFTGEEAEEFMISSYVRHYADSVNFENFAEARQTPRKTEKAFQDLLKSLDSDKIRILKDMQKFVAMSFDEGNNYNKRTRKRLEESGFLERDASLKLNWDSTNSFLDPIYWSNFIKVFVAKYIQHRRELGPTNPDTLVEEAVQAVVKEIPDDVKEDYAFNHFLFEIVDELKQEYGNSFEDLLASDASLKLDWANIPVTPEGDGLEQEAFDNYLQFLQLNYDKILAITEPMDTPWYTNDSKIEALDAYVDTLPEDEEMMIKSWELALSDVGRWEEAFDKVFYPNPEDGSVITNRASLKLDWEQNIQDLNDTELNILNILKKAYPNISDDLLITEIREILSANDRDDFTQTFTQAPTKAFNIADEVSYNLVDQRLAESTLRNIESSLKLNWNPGDPETSQEKKKRLLTIIKHPEYYSYTTSGSPWQMNEYEKALEELKDEFGINIVEPDALSKEDALSIHHPDHVEDVYKDPDYNNPGWSGGPWDATSQKAVLRSAGGMVRANVEALTNGVAVQMYDAFHHAYPDHGEGFCVLNDIAIAAKKMSSQGTKVMIVDTDVHQGQGTAVCAQNDPNIYTLSTHQEELYPYPKEKSSLDVGFDYDIEDEPYLELLQNALNQAISEFQPDLVMYIAGTDLYGGDSLSDTKITIDGIRRRDEMVFKFFGEKGIPVSTSVPQGYARDKADSREMIKNTLREANKALGYYDNSLKLDWAMPTEYSKEYFDNIFENVMFDTATVDFIGEYVYENKAYALQRLREDIDNYSSNWRLKKALTKFVQLIETYGGQEDFENTLKQSFDAHYTWRKSTYTTRGSLKLDWNLSVNDMSISEIKPIMESLQDNDWDLVEDFNNSDYFHLTNGFVMIFPPYDVIEDAMEVMDDAVNYSEDSKWFVQVGSDDGEIQIADFFHTFEEALETVKAHKENFRNTTGR